MSQLLHDLKAWYNALLGKLTGILSVRCPYSSTLHYDQGLPGKADRNEYLLFSICTCRDLFLMLLD